MQKKVKGGNNGCPRVTKKITKKAPKPKSELTQAVIIQQKEAKKKFNTWTEKGVMLKAKLSKIQWDSVSLNPVDENDGRNRKGKIRTFEVAKRELMVKMETRIIKQKNKVNGRFPLPFSKLFKQF